MTIDSPLRTPVVADGATPVLGHAWRLLRDPLGFLVSLRDSGELVTIKLGHRTAYVVCTPELVGELLMRRAQSAVVGGPLWETLEVLIGKSVATSNGAIHRRQRRMIQPAFRPERLACYAAIMAEEAEAVTARWRPGQVVDVFAEMFTYAVRTIARSMMDTGTASRRADAISSTLLTVFRGMYRRMILPVSLPHRLPTPANRRYDRALATLHHIVDEIVAERRADPGGHDDLLSTLLDARDGAGNPLGDEEIHSQVISVLVAATETLASTLVWVFPLLSRHPHEESRLHHEVDTILCGRPVSIGALPSLRHTSNVIVETMRLHTGAWIFTRHAATDIDLGGFRIPAGADIFYSSYALQRDPRSFERPEAFDPDRWLPERGEHVPRFAMIPFGAGNRKCPGDNFSMTELTLLLATVAARWQLIPAAIDLRPQIGITLRPRRLLMRVEPRRDVQP
jgi:epi-isozizaene 5-monooxygenase